MLLVIRSVRAMMTPFNGGFHETEPERQTERQRQIMFHLACCFTNLFQTTLCILVFGGQLHVTYL